MLFVIPFGHRRLYLPFVRPHKGDNMYNRWFSTTLLMEYQGLHKGTEGDPWDFSLLLGPYRCLENNTRKRFPSHRDTSRYQVRTFSLSEVLDTGKV